jgi:hypothetical protein
MASILSRFSAPSGHPCSLELFCVQFWDIVYNQVQLSLTHKQLKVGIANQRHPLTSSESSIAHFKKQE